MSNPFSQEQKLFSIITPIYGWTYQCLEKNATTLNEQSYKTFEWIVVFDGNHPKGEVAIKKVIEKFPDLTISYYTIPHGGAPAARNFGATKAKGDFFVFLNGDNYLYPESLRIWANVYEEMPHINRVWGLYDNYDINGQKIERPVGQAPQFPDGRVWYEAFKYSNYCDSSFPIRREAFIEWDVTVKSLQDWDWAIRQLQRDNFEGKDWHYIQHSFFVAEAVRQGGLSDDSHQNWIDRTDYIRNKNNIPKSDICVVSLGAQHHGFHVAEKLGADYLPMPSFKKHKYKMIYLLGFYTQEDPNNPYVTRAHMQVFGNTEGQKVTKVLHWIGSDILQLRWSCGFEKIKAIKHWLKQEKIINLTEVDFAQKELAEVGVNSKVIPIPVKRIYKPMPLPKEFTVAVYMPASPIYKEEFVMEIVRSMPDVQFYFFGDADRKGQKSDNFEHLGYINMDEWMPKFSCNLRITTHDGLPLLPVEFMTAGRHAVVNVPLKHAHEVKANREEIVKTLRDIQFKSENKEGSEYWTKEMDYDLFAKRIKGLL